MGGLAILAGVCALGGFALNRSAVVPIAVSAWALQVIGRKAGWWGSGVGDGWQAALIVGMFVAAVSSAGGLVVRRRLGQRNR